jgi:FKBP-type peptidyl-prolyl cis-trans isomerase FkpA
LELYSSRQSAMVTAEKEKNKPFLEQAAREKGAQRMESGLIYKETQAGTGAQPKETDLADHLG